MKTNQPTKLRKPVLVVPAGTHKNQISDAQRAGYVVITSKTPDKVRVIEPGDSRQQRMILESALRAIQVHGLEATKAAFFSGLAERVIADGKATPPDPSPPPSPQRGEGAQPSRSGD